MITLNEGYVLIWIAVSVVTLFAIYLIDQEWGPTLDWSRFGTVWMVILCSIAWPITWIAFVGIAIWTLLETLYYILSTRRRS